MTLTCIHSESELKKIEIKRSNQKLSLILYLEISKIIRNLVYLTNLNNNCLIFFSQTPTFLSRVLIFSFMHCESGLKGIHYYNFESKLV